MASSGCCPLLLRLSVSRKLEQTYTQKDLMLRQMAIHLYLAVFKKQLKIKYVDGGGRETDTTAKLTTCVLVNT